jgi:hypothetical protein
MAKPTCPKCDSTRFELAELSIKNCNFRHYAVHCQYCGCVVSILPYMDIYTAIETLAKKLGVKL